MQNNAANQGFRNSWSLMAFAKAHGKLSITNAATHVNSETGEEFTTRSLAFTHPTELDSQGRAKVTFVAFSSNLGELSASEIVARKDELQVAQLKESGNYVLCAMGANSWEDVDLGI